MTDCYIWQCYRKAGQTSVYLPPAGCSIESELMSCPLCLFSFGINSKHLKRSFLGPRCISLPTLTKAIVIDVVESINIPLGSTSLFSSKCPWIYSLSMDAWFPCVFYLCGLMPSLLVSFTHPVIFGTSLEKVWACSQAWLSELTATLTPLQKPLKLFEINENNLLPTVANFS